MTRYEPALDVDALEAIDLHVHIEVDDHGTVPSARTRRGREQGFSTDGPRPDLDSVAAYYRQRGMAAVVFTVDAGHAWGTRRSPPRRSPGRRAQQRRADPVRLPIRSAVPPPSTMPGVSSKTAGFAASSSTPPCRASTRATRRTTRSTPRSSGSVCRRSSTPVRPASVRACQADTASGSASRIRSSSTRSLPTSRAADHHGPPSVPWQDEALAVATHKHNTWIDLSGWSPKYFPAELVRYANSVLKSRVLFGSDFPLLLPDRWIRDAEQTALKPEVMPGIMKHNAARLLRLSSSDPS